MSADEEHRAIVETLARLPSGFLPNSVFHAIARLVVTPTFVVVPLLPRNGKLMALLRPRPADDVHYAGLLHTPGTIVLATDETLNATYLRLRAAELPDVAIVGEPTFVAPVFERIARGQEISLIHWVRLADTTADTDLFDVDGLPGNLIPTEYSRIRQAAVDYRARNGAA